jgi:small subunit ribosomal protein S16
MAVKIRLARRGRKGAAQYSIVVADSRSPRDGRFIEKIGTYNPNSNPSAITLDEERAFHWVMVGAQPTDTARTLLSKQGILLKKHLQIGVNKGAISQEDADAKFNAWKETKGDTVTTVEAAAKAKKDAAAKAELEGRIQAKKDAEEAKAKVIEEAAAKAAEEARVAKEAEEAAKAAEATEEATTEEATEATEEATTEEGAEEATESTEESND